MKNEIYILNKNEVKDITTDQVILAARLAGHANAMISNLYLADKPNVDKIEIWQIENEAWKKRIDKLIAGEALKHTLRELADFNENSAFENNIIHSKD